MLKRRAIYALVVVLAIAAVPATLATRDRQDRPPFSYGPQLAPSAAPSTATVFAPPAMAPLPASLVRFGVNVMDGDVEQVRTLGLQWFILPAGDLRTAPTGTTAARLLFIGEPPSDAEMQARARRFPGTYWLIGNEPNVREQGDLSPERYARLLHHVAGVLRAADPAAKLVGPNVLNWTFICEGCPGYPEGRAWTEAMRAAYRALFGAEPPLDVWSLHAYDIDWLRLPNGDAARNVAQIEGMRSWLDSVGLRSAPLWVTEIGIHWGYPGLEIRSGVAHPTGDFDHEHAGRYLRELAGWLAANAEAARIEKWFLWVLSWKTAEPWQSQWTGISLMAGPERDAPVTPAGRLYRQLAGLP